jgi:hypothetical protein
MPYLINKGRIVLLTDRNVYVLQARFVSPRAKAVRAKFPIGGYRARRSGGDFDAKLVIGDQQIYLRGTVRQRTKRDLAAILASAESAASAPST